MKHYEDFIGCKVIKKSNKPFKSKSKINIVKDVIEHPMRDGYKAFTFMEDDSYVSCEMCELYK